MIFDIIGFILIIGFIAAIANGISERKAKKSKMAEPVPRPLSDEELIEQLTDYVNQVKLYEKNTDIYTSDLVELTFVKNRYNLHLVFDPDKIRLVWTYHSVILEADGRETSPLKEEQDEWLYYMDYNGCCVREYQVSSYVIQHAKNVLLGRSFSSFSVDMNGYIHKY